MLTIFETRKVKAQKLHLKNLVALAKADGIISEAELEIIYKAGEKNGLKSYEVDDIIEGTETGDIQVASNDADRFDQIFDLVQLMLADGNISDEEMDFCIQVAQKLGFRKAIVGVLVRKISVNLVSGYDKTSIKEEAENFLTF